MLESQTQSAGMAKGVLRPWFHGSATVAGNPNRIEFGRIWPIRSPLWRLGLLFGYVAEPESDRLIVGRDAELGEVETWLASFDDRPYWLVLEGEAGIGKTTIWREAARRAQARGLQVLASRPAESEVKLAFSALADLLRPVGAAQLGKLPVPQRQALEVALLRIEASTRRLDRRLVAAALLSMLQVLAGERPVVLAIDDLQWLDAASARTLEYAFRRLEGVRIGLLATVRLDRELSRIALPEERICRLRLGPLTLAALHHLLVAEVGKPFPRLELVKMREACGGNPFYVLEIARTLIRTGAAMKPGEPLPLPVTLGALTAQRIARLPSHTREALRLAALAAEPSLEVLSRAGLADPMQALEPASREGIVAMEGTALRFSHPLLASAVLAGASRERIREIHSMLAEAAESEEARARHLGLAAAGPDPRAAESLQMAANLARRRGAPIVAGELLELARSLSPEDQPARRTDRTIEAAQCYFEAGEADRASKLLLALVPLLPGGSERARALQLLGQIRARSNSFREALALALEALDAAGNDALLRAGIEWDVGFCEFCLGNLRSVAPAFAMAVQHATEAGAGALRAEALAALTIAEFFEGRGVAEARLAEALDHDDPQRQAPLEVRPKFVEGLLMLWRLRLDEALAILMALREELVERGQETALPFLSLFLTIASLWRGDVPGALRLGEEAMEAGLLNLEPIGRGLGLSAQALVDALAGPPERTRQEAAEALALFQKSGFAIYMSWPLLALSQLELSLGNPARVDELLRPLAESITAADFGDPILGVVLPDEIEALVALGDVDRARRYVEWLQQGGRRLDRPWALAMAARGRGGIAAAQGDLESAINALDEAMVEHQRFSMPLEIARTLLVKGQVHRRRKERRMAVAALNESLRIFDQVGAPRWAARARAELARIGRRAKAPADLTETERRIAEFAAAGMTNQQVAKAAFVSPKTVEANLARAYAKLGIRSRAQLAHALDALKAGSIT